MLRFICLLKIDRPKLNREGGRKRLIYLEKNAPGATTHFARLI